MVSYQPPVSLASRTSANQLPSNVIPRGFHTVRGGIVPRGHRLSPVRRSCRCMEGRLIPGCTRILYGCCRRHGPQPMSGQPLGLGFPHRAGRGRPGRSPSFRSRFIGVVDVSDSGVGMFRPRIKLTPRPSANHRLENQCGWRVDTVRGGIIPRDLYFRPRFGEIVYIYGRVIHSWMGLYLPRVRLDHDGVSSRAQRPRR